MIVRIKGTISRLFTNIVSTNYGVRRVVTLFLRIFHLKWETKNMMLHLKRYWHCKNITWRFRFEPIFFGENFVDHKYKV